MGRIWTVCGWARAPLCALLALTLNSCSNANLGWNYFPGYGRLHGYFPPLRVTGPTFISAAASCSSAFKVGFSGSGGAFVSSTADVKLQLGGSGTPTFYADATCSEVITETLLATGESAKEFYLRNPNAGVQTIQTSHPDLPPASRSYQVDPAPPASIRLIRGPATISADTCVEYEFGFFDVGGNQVPFDQSDTLTLTLAGAGGEDAFDQSDTFCQGASTFAYALFPGSWTQIVHLASPNLADNLLLGASTTLLTMTPFALSTRAVSVTPTRLKIAGIPTQLQVGDCDQATAYPTDDDGNPFTAAPATPITFASASGSVSFYTDSSCTIGGSASTANPGFPAPIFVRDVAKEKARITATAAGLSSASIDLEFVNLAIQVAAGDEHTCATIKSGVVKCWGSNVHGQLGRAATLGSPAVPTASAAEVQGLPGPVMLIAAGPDHTCAVSRVGGDDEVWCWGKNDHGQLGVPAGADSVTPVQAFVAVANQIGGLATGVGHTCAIVVGGNLWCWGDNRDGQLGDVGTFGLDSQAPIDTGLAPGWVLASGNTTCTLDFADDMFCFGSNAWGQLQLDPGTTPNSAIPIPMSATVASFGLGPAQACSIDLATRDLACWGRNLTGELGAASGYGGSAPVTTAVSTGFQLMAPPAAVFGGDGFSCAVLYSGVLCFGKNDWGQLGNGSTISSFEPTLIPVFVNYSYGQGFGAGKSHACAVQWDGRVVCWGLNDHAQLGPSSSATSSSAVPIFLSL